MRQASLKACIVTAAAVLTATVLPGVAHAGITGGGCNRLNAGWDRSSCISASGGYVRPDGYIHARPSGLTSSCRTWVQLVKNSVDYSNKSNTCTVYRVTGSNVFSNPGRYFTYVYATQVTGGVVSPDLVIT